VPTLLPPYLIELIFEEFCALLPERKTNHPLSVATNPASHSGWSSRSWLVWCRAKGRHSSWLTVISGTFAQKPSKIDDVSLMAS
jgi:hypothetical protein